MNPRLKRVYDENQRILGLIKGLTIKSAVEEQYFYEGILDKESRGTLKLEFSNGKEIVFNCDTDAESINIQRGGFASKGTLETDFPDGRFRWNLKDVWSKEVLQSLGQISKTEIVTLRWGQNEIQNRCEIYFESGNFLFVWTQASDCIFYELGTGS